MKEKPKYYLDTNVYINFLKNEKNHFGKDLGCRAYNILNKSILCNFHIILSNWVLIELKNKISEVELQMLFAFLKPKIITTTYTDEDLQKAKKMCPEHFQDALHILIAQKSNADAIVTRDVGFYQYSNLIQIKLPEEL